MIMYGYAILPFSYLLSHLFKVPSSAYVWVTVLNIFTGKLDILNFNLKNNFGHVSWNRTQPRLPRSKHADNNMFQYCHKDLNFLEEVENARPIETQDCFVFFLKNSRKMKNKFDPNLEPVCDTLLDFPMI